MIICIFFLSFLISLFFILVISLPSNITCPLVGFSNLKIERAVVVFPQPDSPTKPKVSPSYISKDTSSTAFIQPTVFLKTPFFMGKNLTKFLTCNSELAILTHTPTKKPFFTSFTTLSTFQHLTKCPSSILIKDGSSFLHLSVANRHLGLNLHPEGKCNGLGTIPGITFNLFISTSSRGIEVSKPRV